LSLQVEPCWHGSAVRGQTRCARSGISHGAASPATGHVGALDSRMTHSSRCRSAHAALGMTIRSPGCGRASSPSDPPSSSLSLPERTTAHLSTIGSSNSKTPWMAKGHEPSPTTRDVQPLGTHHCVPLHPDPLSPGPVPTRLEPAGWTFADAESPDRRCSSRASRAGRQARRRAVRRRPAPAVSSPVPAEPRCSSRPKS
jgi:hypothetical protein